MSLLFKKNIYRGQIILLLTAWGFCFCQLSLRARDMDDSFTTKSGTVIVFQRFDRKYYETLQYLKYADRQISALVNSSAVKKSLTCRIFILNEKVKDNINIVRVADNVNIYLHRDFRSHKDKFGIITEMVRSMLLAKTGFDPTAADFKLPQWLLVGIYGRMELRFFSHSILPVAYYPGMKALCQAGKLPNFRISLFTALTPGKDGTAYLLYEELCRFLLLEIKSLSSRGDNPITDTIFLSARKKYSPSQVFEYTIARIVARSYDKARRRRNRKYDPNASGTGKKLQQWFQNTAEKRLINPGSPLQTDYFVKRFYKFRRFTYIYKPKNGKPQAITRDVSNITSIYDKYGPGVEFDQMLDSKILELNQLIFVSQPLCLKYLESLRNILGEFDSLPSIIIRRRLVKTLSGLEQTLEKQKKIENYLRDVEYSNISYGKLYRNELIENKRLQNNFCPSISSYLDKVQESFLKD
jgi:hypothetical protein